MRSAYKILAYAICALVAIQAALMAWAVSGLAMFLEDGGVLDLTSDDPPPFPEVFGVILLNALVLFTAALYAGVWMSRRPTVADQDVAATPKPMASGI